MDKKTILAIIFTLVFLAIIVLIVIRLVGGADPYVEVFLEELEQTVAHWFNTTFGA